jgi:hypothetical protein
LLHLKRQHVESAFQLSHAALQRLLRGARRLLKKQINCSSGHLGDTPDSIGETEFTKTLVFLAGETEADHPAATFNRHGMCLSISENRSFEEHLATGLKIKFARHEPKKQAS